MRFQFLLVLVVTLVISGFYYYKTAPPCVVPLAYSLGTIDERFKLETAEVEAIVAQAAAVWEQAVGRTLFRYEVGAPFTINFIYDERQARSEKAEVQKAALDQKENISKSVGAEYEKLVAEYDVLKKDYDSKVASYNRRLETFNTTVAKYNQSGGAPEDAYAQLQRTEKNLKNEEVTLEGQSEKLATVAKQINEVSVKGNSLITEYNSGVITYNQKYTGGEEFTQGDYKGNMIDVYHFKDKAELKNVLVHEFGHAIGLPHVEGEASIMYYLMDKQPTTSELSAGDLVALAGVCQENETLSTRFHQFFGSFFIKFNLI